MTGASELDPPADALRGVRFMMRHGDDNGDGAIIARAGDVMTCPDGHPVLRIVADVPAASYTRPEWFRCLDSDDLPPVGRLAPCPTCGCEVCPPILDDAYKPTGRYALFVNGKPARSQDRPSSLPAVGSFG